MRENNNAPRLVRDDVAGFAISMHSVFLNRKALIVQVANNDFAGVSMSFLLIKKHQNQQVEFINVEGQFGYTALMHAVLKGVSMLKFFLEKVNDCLAPDDALQVIEYKCSADVTALMLAQGLGNLELTKMLEDAVAKINSAKSQSGEQVKSWAATVEEQKSNSQIEK